MENARGGTGPRQQGGQGAGGRGFVWAGLHEGRGQGGLPGGAAPELLRSILVAVPAAGFLVPLFLLLLIQVMSVSAAERSYEGKVRGDERGAIMVSGCGWSPYPSGLPHLPLSPSP